MTQDKPAGEEILSILPEALKQSFKKSWIPLGEITDLRFRMGKPVILQKGPEEYFLGKTGPTRIRENLNLVNPGMLREIVEQVSRYSLYAYEEEIRQGFLTLPGGHRVGMAGGVVMEKGRIRTISHISSLHIRVAHEVLGAADSILPFVWQKEQVCSALLISVPGAGKTTVLRDLIRQLSNGGIQCGVVDERSELAACDRGIPTLDLGIRTDVMDGVSKGEGLSMLLRSMGPQVLAVDEIGPEERKVMEEALLCGCPILATVHGNSYQEVRKKHLPAFARYVLLKPISGRGQVEEIRDESGTRLY